jgi:hypothetical protein
MRLAGKATGFDPMRVAVRDATGTNLGLSRLPWGPLPYL